MGTIASLLGQIGEQQPRPWDQAQRSVTEAQTGLITLADLKAKQRAEQDFLLSVQNDPRVREALFGGSTLGSLGPGTPPGGGAMTQSTFGPGGVGAPQVVPGGQDLSQFATQGGPDQRPRGFAPEGAQPQQSVLGSLGPAGQPGQMQAPRNPALEMAATNPRAALMLQQQMQGQQDRQWKMQEQRLDWGVKTAEYVARMIGSVKDQASLDEAREQVRQVHPQAAAQMPQMYSKEGIEALQQKGIAVANLAAWQKDMATARRTDLMTQRLPDTMQRMGDFITGGAPQSPTGEAAPTTAARAPTTGAVPGTENLTPAFRTKADSIADRLGANRDDLLRVMHFETGGEMSPATTNRAGSGATGLIQFMPETAKRLGTTTEALAKMSPEQQLDYVEKYLEPYKGKIGNLKDLYMAILYPAALGKADDTVLFSPDKTPAAYRQNAGLDAGNKGYVTVGDAVAAVERTTGGGARSADVGGARGTGTGTAQAPPTDPRIAPLEARIKKGQALVLEVANQPGMEGQAALLNQQVNDLQKERDRLDAPRQEFFKRQAIQPLVLEEKEAEGVARAQLEADTKPATNAEIDAINRGLPKEKQLSYGTTYKEIREKKLVGGGTLDPTVTKDIINTTTAIQQFEELSSAVTALPTGPLTQYVEQFKERWGIDISDEKVAQRAILAGAQSQLLNARSGTAVSPSEYTRLMNELPNEGNDPKVFKARLANTLRQFKNIYKTRVQVLRKLGHAIPDDLMEPLAAPEGAPAPKVSSNVDKFKAIKP